MKKLVCLIGALTLLACFLEAGEAKIERSEWKIPVAPGVVLKVQNHFGDIRLRKGGRNSQLEIFAVFQQLRADGVRLEGEVREDGFVVDWAHKASQVAPPRPAGDRSRVDLVLRVPEEAALRVETDRGLIEAKGVHADLELRSTSGEIRFRGIHGQVQASNGRGPIHGVLLPQVADGRQEFRTVSGGIGLWFSPAAHRTVFLKTSGKISTDFSLVIEHHDGEEPEKYAKAVLAGGGPEVFLDSRIGDLEIRRLPVVLKSKPEETENGGSKSNDEDTAATQRRTPLAGNSGAE